jgi:NAD(P)-dependent dehydrogenase (short-subunit alcohol dehydrogenase family)
VTELVAKLKGEVVLVTGALGSIGRAICQRCLREEASVIGVDIRKGGPAERTTAFEQTGSSAIHLAICDVASPEQVDRTVSDSIRRFGKISVLINNAAVSGDAVNFFDLTLDEWDRVMDINLRGTFLMSQRVAREMTKLGRGRIVNIASQLGAVASAVNAHYLVSKAGVLQLTRAMAVQLAPLGLRVNAIAPGMMATPMRGHESHAEWTHERLKTLPAARFGSPNDIAAAVVFLASDDSDYVYGATLFVDGGYTII